MPEINEKTKVEKGGVPDQIFIDSGLIWGSFGGQKGWKRVPEGIEFLGEKWSQKNRQKIETNRAQEGPAIIE